MSQAKDAAVKSVKKPAAGVKEKSDKVAKFSAEELAAMKERAKELKATARQAKEKEEGEASLLAKVAEMPEAEAAIATRLHELVKTHAPQLTPKTWYGMPAYAKDDKVVCFFQNAGKFKTRYSTLGFNDSAKLDEGSFWPVAYAIQKLTASEEKVIVSLLKKAVG